ncbi:MAG TPA: hypothetical protein VFE47_19250 [Tepidisphaeraceae bacterium]|jgi:hypothetical protein|nr:hypothetical protein [Tepidisphaeraceae bacterium]
MTTIRPSLVFVVGCLSALGCAAPPAEVPAQAEPVSSVAADRELEGKTIARQEQEAARREQQAARQENDFDAELFSQPVYYILNSQQPDMAGAPRAWNAAFEHYVRLGYEYDVAALMADRTAGVSRTRDTSPGLKLDEP